MTRRKQLEQALVALDALAAERRVWTACDPRWRGAVSRAGRAVFAEEEEGVTTPGGLKVVAGNLPTISVRINEAHAAAIASANTAIEHAIECGRLLAEQKTSLDHGEWLPWLAENVVFDRHRAAEYMRLHSNVRSIAHLTGIREALEHLAEPREPKDPPPQNDPPPPREPTTPEVTGREGLPQEREAPPSAPPETSPGLDMAGGMMSSDSDEWYTPEHVWRAALGAMGRQEFDLDPCAEPGFAIPAAKHYTKKDDGLSQYWLGTVWMNPPYSEIGQWVDYLIGECQDGRCTDFAALVPARTDTRWWRALTAGETGTTVLVAGRLKFNGSANSAPFPSALVFGCTDPDDVARECAALGRAWRAMGE